MIINCHHGAFIKIFRFLLLSTVFIHDFFTVILQLILHYILKLAKVLILPIELILTFHFHFIESASMLLIFVLPILLDIVESFLRIFNLAIK